MTPGARIAAAIELLEAVDREAEPPDHILDGFFRKRRYAGSGDRRAITERLYAVLRRRARLDWWLARTGLDITPTPRYRAIADLALSDRTSPIEMAALFDGAAHRPAPLDETERTVADALYGRPLRHRDMPDHVVMEYPGWLDRSFKALWGDRLGVEMSAMNQRAPVDLRVNTLKATWEQAHDSLAREFVEAEPTPLSPIGLRLTGRSRLGGTTAFKEGWVEVQDEGSQLIALLSGAAPGMTVADFCAGAGGKALAMAATMSSGAGGPRGTLHALDVSEYRLDRMTPRLKRAGALRIKRRAIAAKDDPWVQQAGGSCDRVLVDAPCTGTGAWRRDPDARWRFEPRDLDDIRETQRRILDQASGLVAPGGRLIYATCSLLQEENEQQLMWFLENHAEFAPLPIDKVWAETVGGPPPPTGPSLRLSPASTGTDGFYCAVLERT